MTEKRRVAKRSLLIIVVAIVVLIGVVLLAVLVTRPATIELKRYETDAYSIMIPGNYDNQQQETSTVFTKPNASPGQQATIAVTYLTPLTDETRESFIDELKQTIVKESVENTEGSDALVKDAVIHGTEVRIVTGESTNSSGARAKTTHAYFFGKTAVYLVIIASYLSDQAMTNSHQEILDSFTLK